MAKPDTETEATRRVVNRRVSFLLSEAAINLDKLAMTHGITDDEMTSYLAGYPDLYEAWNAFLDEAAEKALPKEATGE